MAIQEKPMLRMIAGGRKPGRLGDSFRAKRIPPEESSFESVRLQYRKILASRYVERKDDGNCLRLDWRDVIKDKKLLIEQAIVDGTISKEAQYAINELKSRFAIVRKEAALYLAYIANDPEIFGHEASRKMVHILLENSCEESREALRCLGFSAEEIWKLKFADTKQKDGIVEGLMKRNSALQK